MHNQRVKITNPGDSWLGTRYIIDGHEVGSVKRVDFHVGVEEVPTFEFETNGIPDIDMGGEVFFRFTPDTAKEAAAVLQNEFKTNAESYKAFVASIESALKEIPEEEIWAYDAAEMIANRILGIENSEE